MSMSQAAALAHEIRQRAAYWLDRSLSQEAEAAVRDRIRAETDQSQDEFEEDLEFLLDLAMAALEELDPDWIEKTNLVEDSTWEEV